MTQPPAALHNEMLQDYVDDELDSATRLEVAQHLASNPEDSATVAAYQAQQERLHQHYDDVLAEAVPERLTAVLAGGNADGTSPSQAKQRGFQSAARALSRGWQRPALAAAAAVVLMVVSGVTGWQLRDSAGETITRERAIDAFLQQAANSYALYGHKDSPWASSTGGDIQTFLSAFQQRVGVKLAVPDLQQAGYQLAAARALPSGMGTAGQLVYRNGDARVTVYFEVNESEGPGAGIPIAPGTNDNPLTSQFEQRNNLPVYYWNSGSVSYALLGNLDKNTLASLVENIIGGTKT